MIILRDNEKLTNEELLSYIGKINGIVYVRVSTADQAKHGYSLESQIERCVERANSKFKIKEDEIIVLVEAGGMGDDPNRPALNYALYLLEKGLGKKFIILHPDRLTRDNTLQGVISRKIWNLGIDLEFVEFEVDPTNPESMLMYNIQGSIAQYNKAKILANSKRGRIQKAKKGEIPSFKRLYGYTYDKESDKLKINKEERENILEMINLLLNKNFSCNQIAQEFSKRGISAPSGDVWYQTTVTRILRNEDYKGIYYHGKSQVVQSNGKKKQIPKPKEEWIAIPIPKIIDSLTFEKVQLKIDEFTKGKGRKSNDYLLKGIARCGRCGSAAGSGITSKVKDGVYKYYACRMKASKGYEVGSGENVHQCKGRNWRVDIVDQVIWDWLCEKIKNPEKLIKEITEQITDIDKINNLKNKKQEVVEKIIKIENEEMNYILLFGKGKINEKQFDTFTKPINEQKEYLNSELETIDKQIVNLSKSLDNVDILKKYLKKFQDTIKVDKLPMQEKRELLRLFVEKVYLHDDGRIEIISKWETNDDESLAEINYDNSHKKQDNVQTYGRQAT
jgi:site-specific DNA recombinase